MEKVKHIYNEDNEHVLDLIIRADGTKILRAETEDEKGQPVFRTVELNSVLSQIKEAFV